MMKLKHTLCTSFWFEKWQTNPPAREWAEMEEKPAKKTNMNHLTF